jgi:hypothetical protein
VTGVGKRAEDALADDALAESDVHAPQTGVAEGVLLIPEKSWG